MTRLRAAAMRFTLLVVLFASGVACTSVKRTVASGPGGKRPEAGAGTATGSGTATTTGGAAETATPSPAPGPGPTAGSDASESADQVAGSTPEADNAGRAGSTGATEGAGLLVPGIPPNPRSAPSDQGENTNPPAGARPPSGGGGGRPTGTPAIQTAARVRMMTSASLVTVGNRLSIRVLIEGASDVASVPFHIVYNPAVLRFVEGREGPFLGEGGRQTAFFAAPMSSGNEMVVGLSRLGAGNGVGGSGELCTLDFTVVGPGNAGLAFARALVRDSANRIVPAGFEPAPVTAR